MNNIIKDEVFNTILGYRDIALMGTMTQESTVECHQFANYWPSFATELTQLQHYIRYEYFNYKLWLTLHDCKEGINKIEQVVHSHDDLPLADYVLGLQERNKIVWQGIDLIKEFDFMDSKRILDFGFGSGFYTFKFGTKANIVYGLEKQDVHDFYINNLLSLQPFNLSFVPCSDLLEIPYDLDVIWLSEVIHGKSEGEILELIPQLKHHLKVDGILVVNELKPDTALSKHFNVQMKLHTSGGKLYTMQDIIDLIPFQQIKILRDYPYHYWIGGTL